jgi:hypothetical protein
MGSLKSLLASLDWKLLIPTSCLNMKEALSPQEVLYLWDGKKYHKYQWSSLGWEVGQSKLAHVD